MTVADAVDYKGFPADKARTGGWIPAALSFGIEICERLSAMRMAVNLVTYLGGTMHLSSATSANVVTDFMGTSFLLCYWAASLLILTWEGDLPVSSIYKTPTTEATPCQATEVTQCKQAGKFQMGILFLSLYLIALRTGGLKSSVSGFGTDQFDEKDEKEKA
ncbi:hypothetical protein DITRI_Ditri10aG0128500 [Diplodiscus trichospermus]